jgi:hypothetical protein
MSIWAPRTKEEVFESFCTRIEKSDDVAEECSRIGDELVALTSKKAAATTLQYFTQLRESVKRKLPGIDNGVIPRCPPGFNKRMKSQVKASLLKKCNDPLTINSTTMIEKVVRGVRIGIDTMQCPMVLFCMAYLVGLRANDMNAVHVRHHREKSNAKSHRGPMSDARKRRDGRSIVGTLLNYHPSKQMRSSKPEFLPQDYGTVFICDVKDYPLMEEAIAFLYDPRIVNLRCTTTVKEFKHKVPSGPPKGQEWRSPRKGIFKAMIDELDLNSSVEKWGGFEHEGLTRQIGRSFVACNVEQGRFVLDTGLTPFKAVELALGHEPLSGNNVNYLKIDVRPTPVKGVTLCKVDKSNPVARHDDAADGNERDAPHVEDDDDDDDREETGRDSRRFITYGLCLTRDSL